MRESLVKFNVGKTWSRDRVGLISQQLACLTSCFASSSISNSTFTHGSWCTAELISLHLDVFQRTVLLRH